ncbi:AAA domain-containing protein [Echinicola rosea]|uniref:DUF4011 domain-containing protein n=1 Tax=Echinicola rosea TaxID=1807691 RepID=A0ABQ1UM70_9BACT|nr:AAA domain-containing protein [Echinicola rosea]GGF20219.1 hypothetical protein GCM10011339_05300 [Echinicola rosea]
MIKDIFQVYMNRLMDLSARNRSIFLPKLVSTQMIDLKEIQFLQHENSFTYIVELLGRKKKVPLLPVEDARDSHINQLSLRLKRIQQRVKLAEEESGEKSLYVAWPFIEGKLPNEQVVRCPLLFFPVRLMREGKHWCLKKKSGDQPFFNRAFLLAYANANQQPFKKEWWENPLELFPKEPTPFRTELYQYLKKELSLNFSQELFQDKLEDFTLKSAAACDKGYKTGVLRLTPSAVLGQFSQKSSFLIRDYEELMDKYSAGDLEGLFTEWFAHGEEEPVSQAAGNLFNTFSLDASQEEVLKTVREGGSCVVEGPPGTGKSQLICNLVTDFIARDKKVLVVSQKRAALDVVHSRLVDQGYGAFLALVHDFRSDRASLFKKITDQINSLGVYKELNRSLDAIQLERNFSKIVRTIENHGDFLEDYRHALFNTEECGVPIKELYMSSSLGDEHLNLTQYYKHYHWNVLDEVLRDLKEYLYYCPKYEQADSFWLHRVDFAEFTANAIHRFKENLLEIKELKSTAELILGDLLYQPFEFPLVYQSFEHKGRLEELQGLINSKEIFLALKVLMKYPKSDMDLLWLENKVDIIKNLLAEEGVEWSIQDGKVEDTYQKVLHVIAMKDSWWKSLSLKFYKKEFKEVWALLEHNALNNDKEGLQVLTKMLENRLNMNHQYTLLDRKPWINLLAKPFDFTAFNHDFHILTQAVKARFILEELGVLTPYLIFEKADFDHFRRILQELIGINELIEHKAAGWKNYFTTIQIKHLLTTSDEEKLDKIQDTITENFTEMVALDRLKRKLRSIDLEVISKLMDEYPGKSFEELKQVFLAGLKISWIEHIEAKYPVLQEMSLYKVRDVLEEFSESVDEKLKISRFMAEQRLRENTFRKLEYNRLNNLVTYRELLHQVTKKKRIWSIKKLVEKFESELFRLVPCWLASPETVSALFPIESRFDLVVFDESSQCFAERGLPAMLRGKQVLIAGDSQQLQPFDLYRMRMDSHDHEDMALEIESLLGLASSYFKKYSLEGHYRSSSLSLIAFSNEHFYQNNLTMLPEMESLNTPERSYQWIKVDGTWDKQTNIVEAERVVLELKSLEKEYPNYSFGVITFNYFQRELINDLLEKDRKLSGQTGKRIKVKNIENVQGDEFDIVLFSIGYAKNKAGKFIANFGSLSKDGGTNRLNVAVTRARRKVFVITSISARDFKNKQIYNPGIRLLRDYLEYAEEVSNGKKVGIKEQTAGGFEVSWYLKHKLEGTYGNHAVKSSTISRQMDLELLEGDRYVGAVLTDDNRLFSAKTAKEAYVYHPKALKEKGWNITHVFSRQYWLDKEDLLQTKIHDEMKKE